MLFMSPMRGRTIRLRFASALPRADCVRPATSRAVRGR
jgi:hypothetical protein